MSPEAEIPTGGKTELIFVSAYHNLPGVSEGERVDYYAPHELQRLGSDLTSYIRNQLDLFSENSSYAEYFSLADYDNPADSISEAEEATFRSALSPAELTTPLAELDAREILHGFRAVILKRVTSRDLAEIRNGIDLFNWIVEGAIECVDSGNPRSVISIESAAQFGPRFVDGLIRSIECLKQTPYDPYERFIGETFAPLKPLLDLLHPMVHSLTWPRNDIAIGELLLIVYYFRRVVEEECQP